MALRFEAYGYFDEAVETAPHIHRQSQKLRDQHAELYERTKELVEYTVDSESLDFESLFKHLHVLLHGLVVHESAVTEMIMNAMFEDIGGGG